MSIATLADLENQVESFLSRAQVLDIVGADNVDNLILLGEKWIFRMARSPEMEATLSGQISSTTGILSVPTGYLKLKHARISRSPTAPLKMRPSHWILDNYPLRSADGVPQFIARDGAGFIFGPFPDSGYTVDGMYYARPTSVLTSANTLFTTNPDLYLFAALAEAEAYVKNDKRVVLWTAKREAILRDVNGEAEGAAWGTGMAVMAEGSV